MVLHLNLLQDFKKKKKVVLQGATTVTNQHTSSWIYLEGMCLQLDSMLSQVSDQLKTALMS